MEPQILHLSLLLPKICHLFAKISKTYLARAVSRQLEGSQGVSQRAHPCSASCRLLCLSASLLPFSTWQAWFPEKAVDTERLVGCAACLSIQQFWEGPQLAAYLVPGTGSAMAAAPCSIATFVSWEVVLWLIQNQRDSKLTFKKCTLKPRKKIFLAVLASVCFENEEMELQVKKKIFCFNLNKHFLLSVFL